MAVSTVPTLQLEREIAARGYDVIVGFDEVGRGSLAGPVMVGAAAIRTADLDGPDALDVPEGVADSKMLTEHRRETIFESLKSWSASWAVGASSNAEIDEWGISYALGVAALRALDEWNVSWESPMADGRYGSVPFSTDRTTTSPRLWVLSMRPTCRFPQRSPPR